MLKTLAALVWLLLAVPLLSAELPGFYKSVDRLVWVVENLEQTATQLEKIGFTNFQELGETGLNGVTFRGRPAAGDIRVASGRFADVPAYWMQFCIWSNVPSRYNPYPAYGDCTAAYLDCSCQSWGAGHPFWGCEVPEHDAAPDIFGESIIQMSPRSWLLTWRIEEPVMEYVLCGQGQCGGNGQQEIRNLRTWFVKQDVYCLE